MNKKTVRDIDVSNKKVLVRCDFNVPQDESGNITDNRRIVGALPTIKYLIENGAKVILCSHLGRPKGGFEDKYSLKPVAAELSKLLEKEVKMADDVIGDSAKGLISNLQNGEVVLLENVRFHKEEEENAKEFSKELASLAEVYVNDAFGTAHRAHSSTEGVSAFLPAVSGFLIEKELEFLGGALENPDRPFVAILGGAKVSDKIEVIKNLLSIADQVLIGGGMAFTFLKAQGYEVGNSLVELDKVDLAKELLALAKGKIILGSDVITGKAFNPDTETNVRKFNEIPADEMGLDIGPDSVKIFEEIIAKAKTVIWNGPIGVFEFEKFANGTKSVALAVAKIKDQAVTIIGGGDSAAAVAKFNLEDKFSHISTGGGASLEYLEGKKLPGIECVNDK